LEPVEQLSGNFQVEIDPKPNPDQFIHFARAPDGERAGTDAREREICKTIGPALRERGLIFVGIDVIDGFLTEINVTSPTGIRAIKNLGGPDVAAMIWDKIEKKRKH